MAQIVTYDPDDADLVLTTRRPEDSQFSESAYFGEADTGGKVVVDDDDSSIEIVGLKRVEVLETAAPVGDQRLYTGFVGARPYRRSKNYGTVGPLAREIEIPLTEINTVVGDLFLRGSTWNRKHREKASTLLAALLASGFIECEDRGKVVYPDVWMDPNDYRNTPAGSVLSAIATVTGYDFTLLHDDEGETVPELFFDDFDRSRSTRPTAPGSATRPTRIPTTTSSCRSIPGRASSSSATRRTSARAPSTPTPRARSTSRRPATAAAFRDRDASVGSTDGQDQGAGQRQARRLAQRPRRGRGHVLSAILNPAEVNKIRRGHRVFVTLTYAPGLESGAWCRVTNRKVSQPAGHDLKYRLDLAQAPAPDLHQPDRDPRGPRHRQLSGAEAGRRPGLTRRSRAGSAARSTPRSTRSRSRGPANANDGDVDTYSWSTARSFRGAGTVAFYWRRARRDLRDLPPRGHGRRRLEPVAEPPARPDRLLGRRRLEAIPGGYTYRLAGGGPAPKYWVKAAGGSRRRSSARSTGSRACRASPGCGALPARDPGLRLARLRGRGLMAKNRFIRARSTRPATSGPAAASNPRRGPRHLARDTDGQRGPRRRDPLPGRGLARIPTTTTSRSSRTARASARCSTTRATTSRSTPSSSPTRPRRRVHDDDHAAGERSRRRGHPGAIAAGDSGPVMFSGITRSASTAP
jgi:hypothetical protein